MVAQIARATEEQRGAAQALVTSVNATAEQAKVVAGATAEQAAAASSMVQATGQIRKVTKEVSQAVNEQGRAARDIIKAAQSTSRLAGQVRKASIEQAEDSLADRPERRLHAARSSQFGACAGGAGHGQRATGQAHRGVHARRPRR